MKTKKKKLIVILSGGGAKANFQVGVWSCIRKHGINFTGKRERIGIPDAVFGISGGATNGVMIAMGKDQELFDMWDRIAGNASGVYESDFVRQYGASPEFDGNAIIKYLMSDLSALQKAGLIFKKTRKRTIKKIVDKLKELDSLAQFTPLSKKIQDLVSIDEIKSELFQAGFVSLTDGKYYSPSHFDYVSDRDFQNAIMASADIPVFWPPIDEISTQNYTCTQLVDGGVRNATPFGDAVKYINDSEDAEYYFLVISCHTGRIEKMEGEPHILNTAKRTLAGVISSEMHDNDLSEFLRVNELVKQANSKGIDLRSDSGRKLRSFKVKIIRPERELGFALDFSKESVLDSFSQGFQVAKKVLKSPKWD